MLTKEQADRVKEIIDGDANLASAYLKVKDINYIDLPTTGKRRIHSRKTYTNIVLSTTGT